MQPDGSPGPMGERSERGVEESEGKRPPNTGARLWGRVRSKLLRQKVPLGVRGVGDGLGEDSGRHQVAFGMASPCRCALLCVWLFGWLALWGAGGSDMGGLCCLR